LTLHAKDPILFSVKVLKAVSLAVLPLFGLHLGCAKLLNIDEKHYVANDGGAAGSGGSGGQSGAATCDLAAPKSASIRIMNAIPTKTVVDLCVKVSSKSSYGDPWFKARGTACGTGVAYSQYTTDLGLDEGTYDFKFVAAGDKCTASGVELAGVGLAKDESLSLVAYGDSLDNAAISPLKNRTPEGLNVVLRFVNALNGADALTTGFASNKELPSTLLPSIFKNVPFGGIAASTAAGPLAFDRVYDDGYIIYGGGEVTRGGALSIGVAKADAADAFLVAPLPITPTKAYSIFALGIQGNIEHHPKIWTCDESVSDGLFLNCGNPVNVSFEVFNPNLADAFTSYVVERTNPAAKAIVAETADVLCVTELYDPKVRDLVRNLPSSQFKSRVFSDDIRIDVHAKMPPMQSGDPAPYAPTACPDTMVDLFDNFLNCGRDATDPVDAPCTTTDAAGDHHLANPGDRATGCFASKCADLAVALMMADVTGMGQGVTCYMCGLTHLASYETFEATRAACVTENTTQPEHFAFGGTSGLAVLSAYPLGQPELVLLPSTGWLRAAMRVPVTLPNGNVVDHWCGSLRFPNTEVELPYAGRYGQNGTSDSGSVAEQKYQIETLIKTVQARRATSGATAIVGLVTYTGPELTDAKGTKLVYAQQADSYALLDAVWPRLVAPDYTPACTYCGNFNENPLNSSGSIGSFWSTHLFAEGVGPADVQSTVRTFNDAQPVTINTATGPLRTPISQHFGLRSAITVTQ